MADASTSTPPGRIQPVRRAFTLPTNLPNSRNSPGASQPGAPDGAETLFTYHTSKIISFTPPLPAGSSANAKPLKDTQEEEPEGVLPWGSHTERTLSTGSLRLYKVPHSTAFLSFGRMPHAIMSKSRCWCVDGESKFVLKIRGNNYYRIELPNSTKEDKDAVAELKTVLPRILQYETTPCPFKRGFYIELPEKPDVILKPWKPKHTPITAKQNAVDTPSLDEGSSDLITEASLHVAKRGGALSQSQSQSLRDGSLHEADGSENSATEDATNGEPSIRYVEGIVSNYEIMKPQQAEGYVHNESTPTEWTGAVLPRAMETSVTSQETVVNEGSVITRALSQKAKSRSPSPKTGGGAFSSSESVSQSDDNDSLDFRPSVPHEDASISTVDDAQENLPDTAHPESLNEEDPKRTETIHHVLGRSFTAPIPQIQAAPSSVSISSSDHHDKPVAEDLQSSASSTKSALLENRASPSTSKELEEDLVSNNFEESLAGVAIPAKEEDHIEDTADGKSKTSLSEAGSYTPEWLDFSPPSSPQPHRHSDTWIEAEKQGSVDVLELNDGELSPASHLRHRLQQRRQISPMPSLTVLHVPSHQHPNVDFAVDVVRRLCRTLFVLSVQIAVLLVGLMFQLLNSKTRSGNLSKSAISHDADNSPRVLYSDSSEDDFASVGSDVASESDNELPSKSELFRKRRASSGVKLRRKAMKSRNSSANSAT